MIPLSNFHRDYLTIQGVVILPNRQENTGIVQTREQEFLPVVPEYERGD